MYEYNDFLERLLFQFKEQRDYELKDVFLFDFKKLRYTFHAYNVCALCSSEEKRMFRGFEPVIEIFKSLHIFVYSPFYKCLDMKQSSQAKKEREKIRSIIQLKSCYPMSNRPILLVDDVCTTGASLNRGIELIHPDCVFVLAAHPLWIQEKQENIVDKSSVFW